MPANFSRVRRPMRRICYNLYMRPEQIPYGVKDFKRIRLEDFYYVDKTAFIRRLEARANFLFFVRPRRFGKSLLCETLRCYYDVAEKGNFDRLFGGLDIGKDPTANASRYFVLSLDFSYVNASRGETWSAKFENYLNNALRNLIDGHRAELSAVADVDELIALPGAGDKFDVVVPLIKRLGYGLYVIVDEYDNFTNEIVSTAGKAPYKEITHGTGFYRGWFKKFKGTCDRIFMTGVSPVTMDDLTSGFNIATNITQEEGFNAMVGFTAAETRCLFEDFQGTGRFADAAEGHLKTVKAWYDSYCFSRPRAGRETLYNCDMALYYLGKLVASGRPPENLIDANIRSDWNKLRAILAAQRHAETYEGVLPLTEELADRGEVSFPLVESFPVEGILKEENFKSLYYYYGIVTMSRVWRGNLQFRIPNECVRRQIFDYMREEYAKRPNAVDTSEFTAKFDAFAWDGEWRDFLTYLAEKYRDNGSPRDGLHGEARINGYLRAYLTMKSAFTVKPELSHPCGYSDYALFPDRTLPEGCAPEQSYLIEMKHSKAGASDAEVAAKHAEALAQLKAYAADPNLPALAGGTPVHFICYEFRGRDLVRLEEVPLAALRA